MPLHAQVICIGGQGVFALLFAIAGFGQLSEGDSGLGWFLIALAVAGLYTLWVLLKFRRYLGAEQALEREAHIERLREEIDQLRANNEPPAS